MNWSNSNLFGIITNILIMVILSVSALSVYREDGMSWIVWLCILGIAVLVITTISRLKEGFRNNT